MEHKLDKLENLEKTMRALMQNEAIPDYSQVRDAAGEGTSGSKEKRKSKGSSMLIADADLNDHLLEPTRCTTHEQTEIVPTVQELSDFDEEEFQQLTEAEQNLLANEYRSHLRNQLLNKEDRSLTEVELMKDQIEQNQTLNKLKKNLEKAAASRRCLSIVQSRKRLEERRQRVEAEFIRSSQDRANRNLIAPMFKMDERLKCSVEYNIPPSELYIELGYNRTPECAH